MDCHQERGGGRAPNSERTDGRSGSDREHALDGVAGDGAGPGEPASKSDRVQRPLHWATGRGGDEE